MLKDRDTKGRRHRPSDSQGPSWTRRRRKRRETPLPASAENRGRPPRSPGCSGPGRGLRAEGARGRAALAGRAGPGRTGSAPRAYRACLERSFLLGRPWNSLPPRVKYLPAWPCAEAASQVPRHRPRGSWRLKPTAPPHLASPQRLRPRAGPRLQPGLKGMLGSPASRPAGLAWLLPGRSSAVQATPRSRTAVSYAAG